MRNVRILKAFGLLLMAGALLAQTSTTTHKATAKPKPATPVDKVVKMLKAGLGEDLVVKEIVKENLKADLSSDDMIRLKGAGATDRVISAMMDPSSAARQLRWRRSLHLLLPRPIRSHRQRPRLPLPPRQGEGPGRCRR